MTPIKQQQKYFFFFYFVDLRQRLDDYSITHKPPHTVCSYRLTEDSFANHGGAKTRFRNNINAIKLLYELEASGLPATIEQQDILAKYIGWGGLASAFDPLNGNWCEEYRELKELLSPSDYKLANESVLSAFYTSKTVIDGIYEGLRHLGFSGGTVLEPALGTGNFIGLMPEDFNARFYGAEVDNITGKIARHLYPNANIQITGFEKTNFPDGFFDAVITNVPFGSFKVYDPAYEKYDLFIHDYFILKCLDKLRPGGIAAIVTSKGTLDKSNDYVRKLFAERAELAGAIRLPNIAFKEAGTEVTSDILFLLKRSDETPRDINWLDVLNDNNGIPINNYYIDNPDMLLGTMVKGKSMYGSDDETYCEPDGRDLKESLIHAIANLPESIYTQAVKQPQEPLKQSMRNPVPNLRLDAMKELCLTVRHILDIQIKNCSDEDLDKAQQKLNYLYNSFKSRYGPLNSKINRKIFQNDSDSALLLSIENYDEFTGRVSKADIFSKRTIRKYIRPGKAQTALEALHICKNETGKVDLHVIRKLCGKGYAEIIAELDGVIYRNPANCELNDKYLGVLPSSCLSSACASLNFALRASKSGIYNPAATCAKSSEYVAKIRFNSVILLHLIRSASRSFSIVERS